MLYKHKKIMLSVIIGVLFSVSCLVGVVVSPIKSKDIKHDLPTNEEKIQVLSSMISKIDVDLYKNLEEKKIHQTAINAINEKIKFGEEQKTILSSKIEDIKKSLDIKSNIPQ